MKTGDQGSEVPISSPILVIMHAVHEHDVSCDLGPSKSRTSYLDLNTPNLDFDSLCCCWRCC